jgi:hypothetical protein
VAAAAELTDDELAKIPLVIGHQDADGPGHAGSTTRKMEPLPTRVVTSMRPP